MINDFLTLIGVFNFSTYTTFPTIIIAIFIYILIGWFYVHVLGKEFHDFVVLSVLTFIIIVLLLLFTSGTVQYLFFGA